MNVKEIKIDGYKLYFNGELMAPLGVGRYKVENKDVGSGVITELTLTIQLLDVKLEIAPYKSLEELRNETIEEPKSEAIKTDVSHEINSSAPIALTKPIAPTASTKKHKNMFKEFLISMILGVAFSSIVLMLLHLLGVWPPL